MGEMTEDEIVAEVSSAFEVSGITRDAYTIRFDIDGGPLKDRFARLAQSLEARGLACSMERDPGTCITVRRLERRGGGRLLSSPWVPRLLFCAVVGFVMIDGYYRTAGTNQVVHIGDPLEMAAVYTAALLGILGVHELGHLVASRMHGIRTSWPYFIPGLPVIGIPTFGALIMAKGLMINREKTFDVAVAGPIAGLAVAILVAMAGAASAPLIDEALRDELYESRQLGEWQFGEPLLMKAALELYGKGPDSGTVLMTPLLFASWVGFFLTFANLMPAGQLDGGHMARTVFGPRALRWLTYASAGILILMNFWFVALFVLFMSGRGSGVTIMDDVSRLRPRRIASYAAVMAMAVLCAPLPESLSVIEPVLRLIQQQPFA